MVKRSNILCIKNRFLTSNAFDEGIVSDFSGGLGPDLENGNDPSPSAFAHAPLKLSGNAFSLQETLKAKSEILNVAYWHPHTETFLPKDLDSLLRHTSLHVYLHMI